MKRGSFAWKLRRETGHPDKGWKAGEAIRTPDIHVGNVTLFIILRFAFQAVLIHLKDPVRDGEEIYSNDASLSSQYSFVRHKNTFDFAKSIAISPSEFFAVASAPASSSNEITTGEL